MKWQIPSKIFLLGEYAALLGESALLLTRSPCFTLTLQKGESPSPFHPDSPAGRFWQNPIFKPYRVHWEDPYQEKGGFGASSAQFLGLFLASCHVQNLSFDRQDLLQTYASLAGSGNDIQPSGYDLLAQSLGGCVYINKNKELLESYDWPFEDITYFLIHTQKKLPTHQHLKNLTLPSHLTLLSQCAELGRQAFLQNQSTLLIDAVNACHQHLKDLQWVATHTLQCIERLQSDKNILAMKGSGAMGADVILVLVEKKAAFECYQGLLEEGYVVLQTLF
jgi:mevalonate kinase